MDARTKATTTRCDGGDCKLHHGQIRSTILLSFLSYETTPCIHTHSILRSFVLTEPVLCDNTAQQVMNLYNVAGSDGVMAPRREKEARTDLRPGRFENARPLGTHRQLVGHRRTPGESNIDHNGCIEEKWWWLGNKTFRLKTKTHGVISRHFAEGSFSTVSNVRGSHSSDSSMSNADLQLHRKREKHKR